MVTRIKAIIFDLDGTLIDSTNQIYQAVSLTRKHLGYPDLNINLMKSKIGLPAKELFSDLSLSDYVADSAVIVFRELLLNLKLEQSDLFEGVFDLLEWAQQHNFKMAVATNKPLNLAIKALKETGIEEFFEHVEGSDNLPSKPNPAMINRCLDVLKVDKDLACMIGDRVEDTLAANSSCVKAIGILQGTHTAEKHIEAGAEQTFQDFGLLLEFVKLGGLD